MVDKRIKALVFPEAKHLEWEISPNIHISINCNTPVRCLRSDHHQSVWNDMKKRRNLKQFLAAGNASALVALASAVVKPWWFGRSSPECSGV